MSERELRITIPGKPQARQAHDIIRLPNGRPYKKLPQESENYAAYARLCAAQTMQGRPPIKGAVAIEYLFVFEAPKSLRRAQREAVARGEFIVHESRRNDMCNLLKEINDALKGIVFEDDGLIVDAGFSKRHGAKPCAIVTIRSINTQTKESDHAE